MLVVVAVEAVRPAAAQVQKGNRPVVSTRPLPANQRREGADEFMNHGRRRETHALAHRARVFMPIGDKHVAVASAFPVVGL